MQFNGYIEKYIYGSHKGLHGVWDFWKFSF